jgi:hypothetical protein
VDAPDPGQPPETLDEAARELRFTVEAAHGDPSTPAGAVLLGQRPCTRLAARASLPAGPSLRPPWALGGDPLYGVENRALVSYLFVEGDEDISGGRARPRAFHACDSRQARLDGVGVLA